MLNTPLFILGAPKSGTTLLQSLLDSHKDISNIPLELRFFQHAGFPSFVYQHAGMPTLVDFDYHSFENTLNNLINHKELNENINGNNRKMQIDKHALHSALESIKSEEVSDIGGLYLQVLKKLSLAISKDSKKYILEKTPLEEEFALELYKYFPDAKFIHIVRNPYSHVVTLRKRMQKLSGKYPNIEKRIINIIKLSYYFLEKNKRIIDNYLVIKYEDLIENPESTMRKISKYLDISYESSLSQPTILGSKWGGNSMYNNSTFSGVDSSNLARWENEITDFEISYTNKYLNNIMKKYYSEVESKTSHNVLSRQKSESLINYIINRVNYYGQK